MFSYVFSKQSLFCIKEIRLFLSMDEEYYGNVGEWEGQDGNTVTDTKTMQLYSDLLSTILKSGVALLFIHPYKK